MKHALLLLILAGLAACAPLPPGPGGTDGESASTSSSLYRAKVHTELAAGYYARGQYAVALHEVHIALAAQPDLAQAYHILGLIRAALREDKEAETAFRRAIALQPQHSEAHNNYGLFLCQRGRVEEALDHFETALGNPLYATPERALANGGACALSQGNPARAEVYFTRALALAPNLDAALLGMAEVDFRSQRLLAARGKLHRLSNQGELGAQALWLGVRVERALGDKAAENSYAAQLRRRFPESLQTQWLIMGQYDQYGGLL
jgi:type IV pilus assembly protein PilF